MKKTIALILAIMMVITAAPMSAFAFEPDKVVGNIEITLDPKIAGKTPADCGEFLTVGGEGITYDKSKFKATYTEGPFDKVVEAEVFEEGKTYSSVIYVYAEEGYILSCFQEDIKYYVLRSTGKVERGFYLLQEEMHIDELEGVYIIRITYEVEAQEPTGIARIPFLIGKFFDAIATFFTETFIQPIADLIMKLS